MTFHAFRPANHFNGNMFYFPFFYRFAQVFIFLIERIIEELHLLLPVTFNAKAHGEIFFLFDHIHVGNITMTFNTLNFASRNVLGM